MDRATRDVIISRKKIAHGEVLLFLHTDKPPTDAGWDEGLELMRAADADVAGDLSRLSILVVTDGGAPTGPMRGRFVSWLNKRQLAVAVVTEGTIARGVVTAISWFNPMIKAFAPGKWLEALRHAHATEAESSELLAEFSRMERSLRRPSSGLAMVRALLSTAASKSA